MAASASGTGVVDDSVHFNPNPNAPSTSTSLTRILLHSAPESFQSATEHPFLRLAGRGTLPRATLSRWLSQDRLYAQSYIGFIGALIARVELPDAYVSSQDKNLTKENDNDKDKDEDEAIRPWRVVTLLSAALDNILRELAFFESTAEKYGLSLDAPSRSDGDGDGEAVFAAEPATQQYIDLFRSFAADPSRSLLEGLVVLWATETVYLRAWTYAASFTDTDTNTNTNTNTNTDINTDHIHEPKEGSGPPGTGTGKLDPFAADQDSGALRSAFIPNWTSIEFADFVRDIGHITDLLAEREDAVNRNLDVYLAVWAHILDVERRFWPQVEHDS
ncbi:hypothetical protein A1O3_08556 [Capronia epimyces CBS 606.96]|uniref:Thiaminase-2/PQQC domain-containing protein n=1 Tax=Capronia epimyces CBS 606.96 TaxID=1182542 RepID=W9XP02_9EURO|nr:uncharacterized protein A1O3_08556 [Capronia epimyces CBS 606.96]EXJ79055.1 hypothetical protein A1O3_08556 [Capronia epimyces CBS 606.96]